MRRIKGERVKTLDNGMRTIRNGLADYLNVPAAQFTKADLRACRDKIAARAPFQANRFLAYLAPCWKWAASEAFSAHHQFRAGNPQGRQRGQAREDFDA